MADVEKQLSELQKQEQEIQQKQTELEKLKNETADYEAKKSALGQELSRVQKLVDEAREQKRTQDKSFVEKLREENLAKVKSLVFNELGYQDNPEAQKSLLEAFEKRYDSGAVTEDKIRKDFIAAHLSLDPEKHLNLEKENLRLRQEAEKFQKEASGSAFTGLGAAIKPEEVRIDEDDVQAAKWAGIPLEKYRDLKARGKIE